MIKDGTISSFLAAPLLDLVSCSPHIGMSWHSCTSHQWLPQSMTSSSPGTRWADAISASAQVKTWLRFLLGYCLSVTTRDGRKFANGWFGINMKHFSSVSPLPRSNFPIWLWVKQEYPGVVVPWEHKDPVGRLSEIFSPKQHHHWVFSKPLNIREAQQVLDTGVQWGSESHCPRRCINFFFAKWLSCSEALVCGILWLWLHMDREAGGNLGWSVVLFQWIYNSAPSPMVEAV